MARKKKIEQTSPHEQTPAEETLVVETPQVTAEVMAQTAWRRWGAPAWVVETRAPAVMPAQLHFEVLEVGGDEIIAAHPLTGVRVLMRRGMIAFV